ncbi:MAG: ferritin-like domain-containing protein [Bacillota bacterium]
MTLQEIIQLAKGNEERGMAFYNSLAGRTTDNHVRQIFIKLAEEEKDHILAFNKIAAEFGEAGLPDKETGSYLSALAQDNVFDQGENPAFTGDINQALALGIQAEKDSILLYHQLYESSQTDNARRLISQLLKAEKLHLVELRALAEDL